MLAGLLVRTFARLESHGIQVVTGALIPTYTYRAEDSLDDRFQEICVGTDWVLADSSFAIGAMRSDIMAG
ncbi:hypothetical protein, partial [Bradyrhizobium sp. 139]|uniref:hypothetical protein n=1 Tax=Bradyrhizobium sp. 139 TaxID=2782616 RepID=UPI001FF84B22